MSVSGMNVRDKFHSINRVPDMRHAFTRGNDLNLRKTSSVWGCCPRTKTDRSTLPCKPLFTLIFYSLTHSLRKQQQHTIILVRIIFFFLLEFKCTFVLYIFDAVQSHIASIIFVDMCTKKKKSVLYSGQTCFCFVLFCFVCWCCSFSFRLLVVVVCFCLFACSCCS